ncbi:flagellar basal body P-ring biosynthesis protein FlgA [Sinorhizobium fredii USDA 205]|uniref:Flagella basal body P-ring formation protein FlgA n=1 Tax=Rhizobium fredii TaxID=380 RepID=A0A844AGH7_RHIFR|nr:flagellar basal body P-ring formation chaperone FlgA [Sinorhizobium fredii]AWM23617.1 Flagellar basal-body P-ring formation protein FlgA [Sinorhizobium fredii CCBAU 25509]KSV92713.1 flagellar basal body P-ring biosynthesis protein FlgA [Sinorhizobium fredii USDA 205]MCG5476572.1 flagellar basal body P-ring formation protein FlgA [Sinorhizobium fredii]MQX10756.1 flagellar basal body P-ring formation protein FlgA [Sinorhizobium fredii]UTY48160.1 flagellar basal body P-ring formation protein F
MRFRRSAERAAKSGFARLTRSLALAAVAAALLSPAAASAQQPTAVIPKQTIYPGETIEASMLEVVDVTNPDLADGYVGSLAEVEGKVTKRTLLPGRVILASALRDRYAVERGSTVRLIFNNGGLTITAAGSPLQDAAVGELIRARNVDSGVIVSGTVMADGTVHVVAK